MAGCKQYQEFVQVFHKFKIESKRPSLRSFPKNYQYNDDKEHWDKYANSMMYRVELDLERAKIFEIDDRTKRAMLMTNIPKDKDTLKTMRLPYKSIFLDLELSNDDENLVYGKKVVGVLISEHEITKDDFFFFVFFAMYRNEGISFDHFKISFTKTRENIEYAKGTKPIQKILERLIVNTILFINEPDVEIVLHTRSKKNQERRIKQGKMPLPNSRVIKLTGRIKKYFDTFGYKFDGGGYSHKFDVRGTWRHFYSERFKRIQNMKESELEKEGYRIKDGFPSRWIPPFEKGVGLKVKKSYSLKKPLQNGEIDLESIKPLDKPLHKIKEKERMKTNIRSRKKQFEEEI